MITTMTNLRATATEAYLKGEADAYSSENLKTLLEERKTRSAYNQSRQQEQGAIVLATYMREQLRQRVAETEQEIAAASTRWEKRLLTGRLEAYKSVLDSTVLS